MGSNEKNMPGPEGANAVPETTELNPPETLDIDNEETLLFFTRMRRLEKRPSLQVNFGAMKAATPASALIFASECDREHEIIGREWTAHNFEAWTSEIRYVLCDMGLFDFLDVRNLPGGFSAESHEEDIHYFHCVRGNIVDDEKSDKFYETVLRATSFFPDKKSMRAAISECMDNVMEHAYPKEFLDGSNLKEKYWWMLASFDKRAKVLDLIFFDQGIGIPTSFKNRQKNLFASVSESLYDDTKLIEEAIRFGKTSTGERNRGKGFPQIIDYIDRYDKSGFIRISSGRGTYIKRKGVGVYDRVERRTSNYPILGTLLEWQMKA